MQMKYKQNCKVHFSFLPIVFVLDCVNGNILFKPIISAVIFLALSSFLTYKLDAIIFSRFSYTTIVWRHLFFESFLLSWCRNISRLQKFKELCIIFNNLRILAYIVWKIIQTRAKPVYKQTCTIPKAKTIRRLKLWNLD